MPKKFDELLSYLANEGNVVSHVPPLNNDLALRIGVPSAWLPALTGPANVNLQIRTLWEPLAQWMPRTRAMYVKHCVALVAVQTDRHSLSLLYCFDLGKSWMAQRGFLPSGPLPEVATRFPVDLRPMYALHNGLVNFATGEDGPLPLTQWSLIPDPPRGGGLLEVLSEGGRSLGFDIGTNPIRAFWLDTDDESDPVEEVTDAWAFIDGYLAKWLEHRK